MNDVVTMTAPITPDELSAPDGLPPGPTFSLGAFAEWYGLTQAAARVVLNYARRLGLVEEVTTTTGCRWRRTK